MVDITNNVVQLSGGDTVTMIEGPEGLRVAIEAQYGMIRAYYKDRNPYHLKNIAAYAKWTNAHAITLWANQLARNT